MTGPDEYSAVHDNNVYTNLMAEQNLAAAADLAMKLPEAADALGVTAEEAASWRHAATTMYITYDESLGVHPQHDYEALTVRDSSLSACTQAVMAAEIGHLELAHDYLAEAALMDLADVEHNTSDGVHLASLAGTWLALVAGFGGMRAGVGALSFSPRVPRGIARLRFRMRYRGRRLRVTITRSRADTNFSPGRRCRSPITASRSCSAPHPPNMTFRR